MPVFTVILSRLILGESQSTEVSRAQFFIFSIKVHVQLIKKSLHTSQEAPQASA